MQYFKDDLFGEWLEFTQEEEDYYFNIYLSEAKKEIRDFVIEMGNKGKCMLLRYYYQRVFEIEDEIKDRDGLLKELSASSSRDTLKLIRKPMNELDKEMHRYLFLIDDLVRPIPRKASKITDEMIQRAREYPIEELIEFRKGFTLCPFHAERTPSFHWDRKNNAGFCFGCKKYADSIGLFMQLNNCDFVEAVRRLQ